MAWGSTEQAQTPLDRLDRNKLDWGARQRSGMDWTQPESTSEDLTGRHCTSLDCLRLNYPGLNWKVPYRTVSLLYLARLICTELHCTFPNETDKDCTGFQVNVLHWTRRHKIAMHSTGSNLKRLFWIA